MDRVGADFFSVVEEIRAKLGAVPLIMQLPIGRESEFEGVIHLPSMKELRWDANTLGGTVLEQDIDPSRREQALQYRQRLVDQLAGISDPQLSDRLTGLFLEGKDIPEPLVLEALRKGTLERAFVPVFCGASLRNMGIQPLLDGIVELLPAPDEVPPAMGLHAKKGEKVEVPSRRDGPPLALVYKIQTDREAGPMSFIRVYSGHLRSGAAVYNIDKHKRERINRLLRMHANRYEQIEEVAAGD